MVRHHLWGRVALIGKLMIVLLLCHSFSSCTSSADSLAPQDAPQDDSAPDWRLVVGLSAAVSLICSIDRASISVAIVPMAEQYGWSDSAKGAISSSFFAGYTITNLVGTSNSSQHVHKLGLKNHAFSQYTILCRCFLCSVMSAVAVSTDLLQWSECHMWSAVAKP